jgi:hypothetical protein
MNILFGIPKVVIINKMINAFVYVIFYALLYLIGRGIIIFVEDILKIPNISNHKINGFPIRILNPVIALFYIGHLVLISNFFTTGVNNVVYILSLIPLFFNLRKAQIREFNLSISFVRILSLIILSVSSNTISFHQDAASYHLNNQLYIRTEKVVLGLGNVYMRYGYSSLSEYINSFFWFDNNFILLHFVNLVFVSIFYFFLIWCLLESNNFKYQLISVSILIYGLLDNFGIEGGRNGFIDIDTIGKQDNSFAILFFITNFFIVQKLIEKKTLVKRDILFILFLILFSAEIRFFGLVSIFGLLLLIRKDLKIILSKTTLFYFSIGCVWIFKNYLITSCLIYPLTFTCLPSPWFNSYSSNWQSEELRSFHAAYDILHESPITWLFRWNERYLNYYVGINLVVSVILIYFLLSLLIKSKKRFFVSNLNSYFYVTLLLLLWAVSAPSIRFGIGIFLILVMTICLKFDEFRLVRASTAFSNTFLKHILLFAVIISTPLIRNYSPENYSFKLKVISPPQIEYVLQDNTWGYGVKVIEDPRKELGFCWLNKECTPPPNFIITEETLLSYRVMILEK